MGLLDLPAELFKHVIHILVRDDGVGRAFKYRLTCRLFASEIYEDIMVQQDLGTVFSSYGNSNDRARFFIHHCGFILYKRLSSPSLGISLFIKRLTNALLELAGSESETLREQYTKNICNAFSGLSSCPMSITDRVGTSDTSHFETSYVPTALPAAAAAVGDLKLFQTLAIYENDIFAGFRDIFPNAFRAAVANDQREIVKFILKNTTTERFLLDLETALRVACRNNRTEIGNMILDFVFKDYSRFLSLFDFDRAIRDSIEFDSHDLLDRIVQSRAIVHPSFVKFGERYGLAMHISDIRHIFCKGSRSGLVEFFQSRFLDPTMNSLGQYLPLDAALIEHRCDLARAILDHGADINMRDDHGNGQTALELAIERGYLPNIQYLIENGAELPTLTIDPMDLERKSKTKAIQLCEIASEHAQGAKLSRDEWRAFWQNERYGLFAEYWRRYEMIKYQEL